MTARDRDANVLGAVAQAITDRMSAGVAAAGGQSVSAAAALSALRNFLHRPTIDQLCQVLGLTPSGTVRLVDRLVATGLVTRGQGEDGRSRAVLLTKKGQEVAHRLSVERAGVLRDVMAGLSPAERATLRPLLGQIMTRMVASKDGGAWICRLCDLDACGRGTGHCPAANAAVAKYGQGQHP